MVNKLALLRLWAGVPLMGATLAMSGCSAGKPPVATLSQADMAIQQADKSTASQHAPLELQTARERLAKAMQAMEEKEYDAARRLAGQSLVDAQLAEAKAQAEKARQAAAELRRSIETLRTELERVSTPR
jgi:acyl-CoA reductase-like NAD-dependent aldehyde dehydrogenase